MRSLFKAPAFTLAAILSLALGIGANTAIFSLLDAIALRSLPVEAPGELVAFGRPGKTGQVGTAFSYPFYRQVAGNPAFAGVLAQSGWAAKLGTGAEAERVSVEAVTGNYFDVLGVRPLVGRSLEDDAPVAVLSHAFWRRRFAGDAAVVGRGLLINDAAFTIAGVAPPGFFGTAVGDLPDMWVSLTALARVNTTLRQQAARPQSRWLQVLGRLRPGVTPAQAAQAVTLPREMGIERLVLLPAAKGISGLRGRYATALGILMAGVALLLLIACTNVANLLLARAAARQREIAVRLALGASRARLLRQSLLESLILSLAGGALALPLAFWSARLLLTFVPATLELRPDPRVFGFAFTVSVLCGLLFGLAPALQGADPAAALTGDRVVGRTRRFDLRGALVIAQVALSFLLLAGAGLFSRTLSNLAHTDPGFARDSVVVGWLDPMLSGYDRTRAAAVMEQLADSLAAHPAVESASFGSYGALSGGERNETVDIPGRAPEPGREFENFNVLVNIVGRRYFETLRIPLFAGRDFSAGDRRAAVLSESAARYFFGNEPAVGRRIVLRWLREEAEVIGVVKDTSYLSLRDERRRILYLPARQHLDGRILYVRTRDANAAVSAIRSEARAQHVVVSRIRTLAAQIDDGLRQERLLAMASALFGGLALLLAAVGIYGLVSYAVARRTREIGIRVALGAHRGDVLWMVLRQALLRASLGLALGIPAALVLARFVSTLLFGVRPDDPTTLAASAALLLASALAAAVAPAWRATRIDPATTLRAQ